MGLGYLPSYIALTESGRSADRILVLNLTDRIVPRSLSIGCNYELARLFGKPIHFASMPEHNIARDTPPGYNKHADMVLVTADESQI
jgi:hypothetical protein